MKNTTLDIIRILPLVLFVGLALFLLVRSFVQIFTKNRRPV